MQTKKLSLLTIQSKMNRAEMKGITGGTVRNLIGFIGGASVGYCLCDFYNTSCPNNVCCEVSCPVSFCNEGSLDPNVYPI